MYVNYYKKTQMIEGENEPIGILICADKDDAKWLLDNFKIPYQMKDNNKAEVTLAGNVYFLWSF